MVMTPTDSLGQSLERNIHALHERREREARAATLGDKMVDAITGFTGSLSFVYIHIVLYGAWLVLGLGLVPWARRFHPSLDMLAMEASVEAIFLSTFVLISQNRTNELADRRADLDLHINLLTESELSKVARLVAAIAERLDVHLGAVPDLDDITREIAPEDVLDRLDANRLDPDRRDQPDR